MGIESLMTSNKSSTTAGLFAFVFSQAILSKSSNETSHFCMRLLEILTEGKLPSLLSRSIEYVTMRSSTSLYMLLNHILVIIFSIQTTYNFIFYFIKISKIRCINRLIKFSFHTMKKILSTNDEIGIPSWYCS